MSNIAICCKDLQTVSGTRRTRDLHLCIHLVVSDWPPCSILLRATLQKCRQHGYGDMWGEQDNDILYSSPFCWTCFYALTSSVIDLTCRLLRLSVPCHDFFVALTDDEYLWGAPPPAQSKNQPGLRGFAMLYTAS